ncbi:uncharacterized protein LOC131928240 [Physella acuta]|uniref:uncharacterized protein LOC131928240 n=1 Tax=Physella acuta TaxID=109671 RepID=UPI0027DB007E|nr:uncharacterized protein LOC131928240 [Physella acuta]
MVRVHLSGNGDRIFNIKKKEIREVLRRTLPLRSDKEEGSLIYNNFYPYNWNIGTTMQISFHLFNEHAYHFLNLCYGFENVKLQIISYDDENNIEVTTHSTTGVTLCTTIGRSQFTSKLKISLSKVDHLQAATIWELRFYGDCEAPYYGLECDHVCSRSCYKRVCYLDGTCRACYHGWKGAQCDQEDTEAFYEIKGLITQKPWPLPPVYPPPPQPRYNSTFLGLAILLVGSVIIALMIALTCYLKPVYIVATIDIHLETVL